MGDSDDDYETSMSKRRGQSRNKFRKERDDAAAAAANGNGNDSIMGDHHTDSFKRKESRMSAANDYGASMYKQHSSSSSRRHSNYDNGDEYGRDAYNHPQLGRMGTSRNERSNSSAHRNSSYGQMERSSPPSQMKSQLSRERPYSHNSMGSRYPDYRGHHYNYHHEDDYKSHGAYKRPPSPSYGYPGNGPPPYYNQDYDQYGYYDGPPASSKKPRRDWSVLEGPPQTSGYYEHDNRLGPDLADEFVADEFNGDYNRLNRPPNFPTSYRYDQGFNNVPPSNNHFYNQPPAGFTNGKAPTSLNPFAAAATAIMSTVASQVATPIAGSFGSGSNSLNPKLGILDSHLQGSNQNINSNMMINTNLNGETQPQMLSFKQFLLTLNNEVDGNVSNEIANKRYNEYKNQFRRDQIAAFFSAHKHEEWFKFRYHPEDSTKRKEEQRESVKRRLTTFMSLLHKFEAECEEKEYKLTLEVSSEDDANKKFLYKFLDACMIKLEDGTDEDLETLEKIYNFDDKKDKKKNSDDKADNDAANKKEVVDDDGFDENIEENLEDGDEEDEDEKKTANSKFNRNKNKKSSTKEAEKSENDKEERKEEVKSDDKSSNKINDEKPIESSITIAQKTQSIFFKHLPVIVTRLDLEKIGKKYDGFKRASISEPAPERRFQRRGWITFDSKVNIKDLCSKINGTPLFEMQLNATINRELDQKVKCISGIANYVDIIRNDLKLICKVVESMDKRWRLWQYASISNKDETNAKVKSNGSTNEITVEQNNKTNEAKEGTESTDKETTKDCVGEAEKDDQTESKIVNELNKNPLLTEALNYLAYLNELSIQNKNNTVKTEKEIEEKQIVEDKEVKQTNEEKDELLEKEETEIKLEVEPANLSDLTSNADDKDKDQLILNEKTDDIIVEKSETVDKKDEKEEVKAASQQKLIATKPATASASFIKMEKDDKAASLLDKLILYLRLVHSIDYYNATEYQQEDWMPNRCGVLHVRAAAIQKSNSSIASIINGTNVNHYDPNAIRRMQIDEWIRLFDIHIRSYSDYREHVDMEQAKRLGYKELKAEIEKFISANCQQLEKNIWLCPLSGKKFKGPDYVRKHIETKHSEKLAEIEKEVDFFNRFVLDPKRPYLPEHPLSKNMSNQGNNFYQSQNNFHFQQPQMFTNSFAPAGYGPYNDYPSNFYPNRGANFGSGGGGLYPTPYNQPFPKHNTGFNNFYPANPSMNDNYHHHYQQNYASQSGGRSFHDSHMHQPFNHHHHHGSKIGKRY